MAGYADTLDGDGDNLAQALRPMPKGHKSMMHAEDIHMGDHSAPSKHHNGRGNKAIPTKSGSY